MVFRLYFKKKAKTIVNRINFHQRLDQQKWNIEIKKMKIVQMYESVVGKNVCFYHFFFNPLSFSILFSRKIMSGADIILREVKA